MILIEPLESSFALGVGLLKLIIEFISALCIAIGLLGTLRLAFQMTRRRRPTPFIELRLAFGTWLALALELQLGADILATTLNPSFDALAKLAIVAVVRTFLNYFLNKELQEETELQRRAKTVATTIYSKEQEES